jgi:outer membrane protein TolC
VQARARLDTVTIDTVELKSRDALDIALANRLDFMNARAALVDSWRSIQVNADALQSVLNVTADGNLRTARNNPVSFRAPTANLHMGFEFDAPFTRLLERNAYRESLINYQQSRRGFIQSCDALHLGLRQLLREIEQLRESLEIQRGAVAIAIQRVDMTRAWLYAPVAPPRPGQRPMQFGTTTAINLLSAQSALRDTQNAFLGVWLDYYAAKMRLARELGVMLLDRDGAWMENAIDGDRVAPEELPPPVPTDLLEALNADQLPPPAAPVDKPAEARDGAAADRPNE